MASGGMRSGGVVNEMEVAILGPSARFLSGVSYFTMRLSNALSDLMGVKAVLFRKMLPRRLFLGWRRVGRELTSLRFDERVEVHEILDWYNPLTWLQASRIVRDVDALILQWWTSSVAHMYLAVEVLNMKRKPVVVEFHEVVDPLEYSILPIRAYSRVAGRLVRGLAAHFVVHSPADRELIGKAYGIERERITVIPHGIYDHYERIPKDEARAAIGVEEEFVILFFGLLRPYKGVRYLVKAFERLPEGVLKESRLLIVGEPWEDREAIELARRSEVKDRITVVDRYVSDDEVSLYFSASDVLVLPYTRASQSGVAHIGMFFGLPIIASEVGGLKESLGKYEGARFVELSVEEIAEGLTEVFERRGRRYEPPKELSWGNIARRWKNLLELLTSGESGGTG